MVLFCSSFPFSTSSIFLGRAKEKEKEKSLSRSLQQKFPRRGRQMADRDSKIKLTPSDAALTNSVSLPAQSIISLPFFLLFMSCKTDHRTEIKMPEQTTISSSWPLLRAKAGKSSHKFARRKFCTKSISQRRN